MRERCKTQQEMVRTAGIMKGPKPGSLNSTFVHPLVGHYHCPWSTVRRPLTAE